MSGEQRFAEVIIKDFDVYFTLPLYEEGDELYYLRSDIDAKMKEHHVSCLVAFAETIPGYGIFIPDTKRPWDGQTIRCKKLGS